MLPGLVPVKPFSTPGHHGVRYDNGEDGSYSRGQIRERVSAAGVAQTALTNKLPANSRVIATAIRCVANGTIANATRIAVGINGGDPDAFMAAQVFNDVNTVGEAVIAAPTVTAWQTSETTLAIGSTNDAGAAAGSLDTGSWDVIVFFETFAGWNLT